MPRNRSRSDHRKLNGRLGILTIARTPVSDLTPLKDMPLLSNLDITDTPVADLSPLDGMGVKVVK